MRALVTAGSASAGSTGFAPGMVSVAGSGSGPVQKGRVIVANEWQGNNRAGRVVRRAGGACAIFSGYRLIHATYQ